MEEEGAGLGQVSVLAAAGSPNVNPAARFPGGRQGGEVRLNVAKRRRKELGVGASGPRGSRLGPSAELQLLTPPRPGFFCHHLGFAEFFFSLKRTLRQPVRRGRPGLTHLGSAVLRSPSAVEYWGIFFFA